VGGRTSAHEVEVGFARKRRERDQLVGPFRDAVGEPVGGVGRRGEDGGGACWREDARFGRVGRGRGGGEAGELPRSA